MMNILVLELLDPCELSIMVVLSNTPQLIENDVQANALVTLFRLYVLIYSLWSVPVR